ncbi:Phosphatidate cytidylyltransferase, mitochondrial [Aphelenchoides fujianensis]|nr:Phosphatidate cytidylyltransferase, mitochondrial [Aphelenchoides fujianensis]
MSSELSTSQKQQQADDLLDLIECLPLEFVEYAFSYGSGAVQQRDERKEEKMVDFIVVTNDTMRFHESNVHLNPRHYSAIRWLRTGALYNYQRYFGARVFYNTRVRSCGRLIKYGVIDSKDLAEDLLEWRYLYVAGRMHKPIVDVMRPNETMAANIEENRRNALQVALLQIDETFTLTELFRRIARISYDGDFRQKLGEDKNKIEKVVAGAHTHFSEIYVPMLEADKRVKRVSGEKFEHDVSTVGIYHRLNLLPSSVLEDMSGLYWYRDPRNRDIEEIVFQMSHRHDVTDKMGESIRRIVKSAAWSQSAKNAVTAGLLKSVLYSGTKLAKMMRSM